jgi:hypothetical protein
MARGIAQTPTLTRSGKTANPPSPTDSTHTSGNFDFPTLNNDGSVSDLIETHPPPGQRTPPAALSSLGLKMAADSSPDGVTDLNDGEYDMMSDASDTNETVSIASDNLTSDDELMTPDYDEDEDDDDQALYASNHPSAAGPSAGPLYQQLAMLDMHQHERQQLFRRARERSLALQKEQESEKERQMNSFLSEDLETPRQSTMNAFNPSSSTSALDTKSSPAVEKASPSSPQAAHVESTMDIVLRVVKFAYSPIMGLNVLSLFGLLLILLSAGTLTFFAPKEGPTQLYTRRDALSGALGQLTNSTNATKSFNIEHLLPVPTNLHAPDRFGRIMSGTSEVHFQGAQPSYIVVSLPRKDGSSPQVVSASVYRGDKSIAFNQTKLIDGVYAITLDPHEAYGIVTVSMPCKKPELNVTVSHNFGRRYLQLPNFEKARTEISNTVTKDIAVARAGARGITDCFTAIWGATHNVSTQLVQQVGHEAQVLANNTVSLAGKLYSVGDATAAAMRKDIIAVQEGFARAETQVDDFVADVAVRVKRSVMEPLAVAHDRAGRIRAKYFGSEAAREKVCKRDVPSKDSGAALFAAKPKCKGKNHADWNVRTSFKTTVCGSDRTHKDGKVVTKTTCGACDGTKKNIGLGKTVKCKAKAVQ